jgi:hypothetical protein
MMPTSGWTPLSVLAAVGLSGLTVFIFVMGYIYGGDRSEHTLFFDLTLGQQADVRYTCECPQVEWYGQAKYCRITTEHYQQVEIVDSAGVVTFVPADSDSAPPQWRVPPGLKISRDYGLTGIPTETGTWYSGFDFTCYYGSSPTGPPTSRDYTPHNVQVSIRVGRGGKRSYAERLRDHMDRLFRSHK